MGIKRLKTYAVPAKTDVEEQESLKKRVRASIRGSKSRQTNGFLWMRPTLCSRRIWADLGCFTRMHVRAPSGRQRLNVLGALNAVTHELLTVTNDSYINSTSVGQLLEKIAALGLQNPITLVMDNARYQRCKYVFDIATRLNIEILFLPPYSPNLNLIERLWKFVKKECLYSTYYGNFQRFK